MVWHKEVAPFQFCVPVVFVRWSVGGGACLRQVDSQTCVLQALLVIHMHVVTRFPRICADGLFQLLPALTTEAGGRVRGRVHINTHELAKAAANAAGARTHTYAP